MTRREIAGVEERGDARNGENAMAVSRRVDLRGIKCPLNWAHAKVQLETMRRGEVIELLIDDPRGVREIPRAAEAEGHILIEVKDLGPAWRLTIEK